MPAVIITMLVILLVAAAIIAIVAMGMQGHAREVSPELADAMETTARHLNGDAEPPRGLVAIFDEIDELPSPDLRDIPARIRSMRSARSAASATSASVPEADEPDAGPDVAASPGEGEGASAPANDAASEPSADAASEPSRDAAPEPSGDAAAWSRPDAPTEAANPVGHAGHHRRSRRPAKG